MAGSNPLVTSTIESAPARKPGRSRRWFLLPVVAGVLIVTVALAIKLVQGDQSLGEVALHPYPAPDFSMTTFSGQPFSLQSQRGKVVVLNFWASWCVPCQQEAATLESSWQRYQSAGVVFAGVDIKDTPDAARTFLQRYAATYPNGFDANKQIYIDYGVYGLPETFVIDAQGNVIHHVIGAVTSAQLNRWLLPVSGGQARQGTS